MDLEPRLQLAARNLLGCLSRDDGYLPYWHMAVDANLRARYEFRPRCTGHNVGRWWNALLRLEQSCAFEIPAEIEDAMLANSWRLGDNASGIFLEDIDPAEPDTWYIHSYRETMLSFGLLARHRQSDRAREHGLRAVEGMSRASRDPTAWQFSFGGHPPLAKTGRGAAPAYTHGRAIEGLLCFHEATGEEAALAEAERLAAYHFEHLVESNGSLAAGCGHHTHSYLNTIRGLLLLASMKGWESRIQALRATYADAIAAMITPSGFIAHDIGARYGGDIASAGDIAHIALLLWDRCRDPRLLDDAERLVRARLLPAQVREPVALSPLQEDGRDCHRDLAERFLGTIGGSVGHVSGQTCVTDFTAAALHSLIELYDRTVDVGDDAVRVNFHFERSVPGVEVSSQRDGTTATVAVRNATGKRLFVRVPAWTDPQSVSTSVDGRTTAADIRDGFASMDQDAESTTEVRFALPRSEVEERTRDEGADSETVTFSWCGDEIVGVSSGGQYMPARPAICESIG